MKNKTLYIKTKYFKKFKKENQPMIRNSSAVWEKNRKKFRKFWNGRIMNKKLKKLSNGDMDKIIRIMDVKGSGKKKGDEAVALMGIRQGAWYGAFRSIKNNSDLRLMLNSLLKAKNSDEKIQLLNRIEKICEKKNICHIAGKGANILNNLMFINDPENNISMVSLRDRYQLIGFLGLSEVSDIMVLSFGQQIIKTRDIIISLNKQIRLPSNRLLCNFLYYPPVRAEWKTTRVPEKRPEYGEIIDFRGFIYAPVNHEGTVALFGAVAKDLGFNIEKVRNDYPDIEAIYNGKRVNIEIEYLNSEFNHNPKHCDILVCWKKNTRVCPVKNIIELKKEIKNLK